MLLSVGHIKEPEQIFDSGHMYTGANYLKLNVIFEPQNSISTFFSAYEKKIIMLLSGI